MWPGAGETPPSQKVPLVHQSRLTPSLFVPAPRERLCHARSRRSARTPDGAHAPCCSPPRPRDCPFQSFFLQLVLQLVLPSHSCNTDHIRSTLAMAALAKKATPKAGITLFSKEEDGFKFVHSPTASGEVALKHKIGNRVTLGVGFSVSALHWRSARGSGSPLNSNLGDVGHHRAENQVGAGPGHLWRRQGGRGAGNGAERAVRVRARVCVCRACVCPAPPPYV